MNKCGSETAETLLYCILVEVVYSFQYSTTVILYLVEALFQHNLAMFAKSNRRRTEIVYGHCCTIEKQIVPHDLTMLSKSTQYH